MINNDILKRLSRIFDYSDEKLIEVFDLGQYKIKAAQLALLFKEKDDPEYIELEDVAFASFLNGLIIEKRGAKDGQHHPAETHLSNNQIFNKIKISLALKADEVIVILDKANCALTKYELSAFFRNVNHKHYKDCSDIVLNAFLNGLEATD